MKKKIFIFLFIVSTILFAGFFYYENDGDKLTSSSSPVEYSRPDYFIPGMTTGANMPTYRYHAASFSYVRNDTGWIFIAGGDLTGSGTITNICERYNVRTNVWTTVAPVSTGNIWYAGSCTIKDTGYICGGNTGISVPATSYVTAYYINTNTWAPKVSMPMAIAMVRAVSYQDSLLYTAGGFDATGVSQTSVFLYNAHTNTWRAASPLPGSRMGGAFARSGDTLVYVNGTTGNFNGTVTNTTFVGIISQFDRASITWTTKSPYPGTSRYRQDAQNWGCKGIVVSGGASAAAYTPAVNECYVYSPGLDLWTVQPTLITSRTAHMTGSVKLANNVWKFVNVCGFNGVNVFTTDILTDTICGPLGVSNYNEQIPEDYFLLQNYPNPFNPMTVIKFGLPTAEYVKLAVYDVLGREVKTLIDEFRNSGVQEVTFDAAELSSGVYFYRIETDKFIDVKKMILVK